MSGYPPPSNSSGFAPYSSGNCPPYPPNNSPPTSPDYPYPSQAPYANPQQNMMMSGDNTGYPVTGYPTSSAYPNTGAYPNPGYVPNSGAGLPAPGFNPQFCPTAPDLSQMEKIPGYERLTFQEEIVKPPALPDWQPEIQERQQLENLPSLTEDDVREAAIEYSDEHCCYRSNAAKNMVIPNITMMSAFHYKLETFGEKRESAWRFEPYDGQAIDGPMNGPAPHPWDVKVTPHQYFKDGKKKMEVPHTAFVKPCHTCVGNGRVRCETCIGNGRSQCTWCKGRGRKSNFDNDRCTSCNGEGTSRCSKCQATGQVKCKICDGKCQLKGYVELTITWTNHVDDYISETSSLPKELVRGVSGQVAFEEEHPRVYPIMHTSDEAVRKASNEYIKKHNSDFPNERIIKQKHCIRLIPIGEVNYVWKEKTGLYYVYGYEHKVYFIKYPQKCCTII